MELTNLEPLPILVFSNLLMVVLLLLLSWKGFKEPFVLRPWRRYLIILVALVFCLFSFWGTDWFHYAEMYLNLVYMDGFNTSLEDVYYYIANLMAPNYLVFRAIIWGAALYLMCLLMKHASVRGDLILCFFCSVWLIYFGYGRISLAYAAMYLGGSVICKPVRGKVLLSLILGSVLLISSLFFHKSSIYGVVLILLAFLPKMLNKRTFLLLLMIYPFVVIITELLLAQFMDSFVDPTERNTGATAGMTYLTEDTDEIGFAYNLQLILECIPYYMLAYLGYRLNILTEDAEDESGEEEPVNPVPADVRFFGRLLFYIVATASVFAFNLGVNTRILFIRFLRFGFIPACIVLAWAWQNGRYTRLAKFSFLFALASTGYALLYSFYVAYVGAAI
ncbi:MAG: EpsG family protein [Bacteroidaceae bacterium]|nr:EpsG family protein [Bacteroidaceae bacterium]